MASHVHEQRHDYSPIKVDASTCIDSDSETDINSPQILTSSVNMATKLKKIERRTKKRVKGNKSLNDWWLWYWQSPKAHFPFLYFLCILLCCAPLTLYWFMDHDTSFVICGILGLSMFIYSGHKFKLSINLKKEINKYTYLNYKLKQENRIMAASIKRLQNADHMLRQTQVRLTQANDKNHQNLKRFQQVERHVRMVGEQAHPKLAKVNQMTHNLSKEWRNELIHAKREMLQVIFDRLTRNKTAPSLTRDEFEQFHGMLPKASSGILRRVVTFDTFSGGKDKISTDDFVKTLDAIAMMATDDKFYEFIVTSTMDLSVPSDVASFSFTTSDVYDDSQLSD
eukprot:69371_1